MEYLRRIIQEFLCGDCCIREFDRTVEVLLLLHEDFIFVRSRIHPHHFNLIMPIFNNMIFNQPRGARYKLAGHIRFERMHFLPAWAPFGSVQ